MGIAQNGVFWPFKTLLQGAGISLQEDATTIRITATGGGSGGGGGDMLSTEYATNGQPGKVDHALVAETVTGTVANATNAQNVPWTGVTGAPSSFPSDWSVITSKPTVFPPATHGLQHLPGGLDPVGLASASGPGWLGQLDGNASSYIGGDNACHPLSSVPSGSLQMWATLANIPAGWLACNGAAIGRTLYPALFAALTQTCTVNATAGNTVVTVTSTPLPIFEAGYPISGSVFAAGTTIVSFNSSTNQLTLNKGATQTLANVTMTIAPWGVGDGSTTFQLPDLRGRSPLGWGGSAVGLTGRRAGLLFGEENHTLSVAEMPSHGHGGAVSLGDPGHAHTYSQWVVNVSGANSQAGTQIKENAQAAWTSTQGTGMSASLSISANGGGGVHNTIHPIGVVNYIIKT